MDLTPYIDHLQHDLAVAAAAGGDEARALAERLTAALESAAVVVLLDALSAAADEITLDLAPGSVEVRLRGREPSFVVIPPDVADVDEPSRPPTHPGFPTAPTETATPDDGGTSRLNLRLPESLKQRIEEAAQQEGLSLNAWLVRAATTALDRGAPGPGARRSPQGGQHVTGWVR